jgi:non-ribosomal peptide synthetase component F
MMGNGMSLLAEFDSIRDALSMPGQPFELTKRTVNDVELQVYKHLPPNLGHFIVQSVEAFADRTFLVNGADRMSFRDALARAAGLCAVLRESYHVGPGVRVAIAMRNSPEWVFSLMAILLSGATAALVNSRGTPEEMLYAIHDVECAVVIADPKRAEGIIHRQGRADTRHSSDRGRAEPCGAGRPRDHHVHLRHDRKVKGRGAESPWRLHLPQRNAP